MASSLLQQLASLSILSAAWNRVRIRSASAGIDGVTVPQFASDASVHLRRIQDSLLSGQWRPKPGRRVRLKSAPQRPISVSTVADRVVQRALCDVLTPILDPLFSPSAYGFRPGRGVQDAIQRTRHHIALGRQWVVRTDIESFFDRIDRAHLLTLLHQAAINDDICVLIRRVLTAGLVDGAGAFDTGIGVAQGSPLSPLLSNVYLLPFDNTLEIQGFPLVRYADDILILTDSEESSVDALRAAEAALEPLRLRLSPRKTRRRHVGGGFVFLGVRFDPSDAQLSEAAWEAMDEVANKIHDPDNLAELYAGWKRWYGFLPQAIPSLAVLAAAAFADPSPARLAALRPNLRGQLDVAIHVALCKVWARSPKLPFLRALLIDATVVAKRGSTDQRRMISDLLNISVRTVESLWRSNPVDALKSTRPDLAQAWRSLHSEQTNATAPLPASDRWLQDVFPDTRGILIDGVDRRGHSRPLPSRARLTDTHIQAHLNGGPRVWCWAISPDGTGTFATISYRVRREKILPPWLCSVPSDEVRHHWKTLLNIALTQAVTAQRRASARGIRSYLEDDGADRRTVWFFFDAPIPLRHLRSFLQSILNDLGELPKELRLSAVPQEPHIGSGKGPIVLLPLGVHPRTRQRSQFVDSSGKPCALPIEWASASQLMSITLRGPLPCRAGIPPTPARTRRVLESCAPLRVLADKAQRLTYLSGKERRTLIESLGHLPKESVDGLTSILSATGHTQNQVKKSVERLHPSPLRCAKIRLRHPHIVGEVPCNCRFRELRGSAYPTPALHAARPWEINGFRPKYSKRVTDEVMAAYRRWRSCTKQVEDAIRGQRRAETLLREHLQGYRSPLTVGDEGQLQWSDDSPRINLIEPGSDDANRE